MSGSATTADGGARPLRVLVVEDDPEITASLTRHLDGVELVARRPTEVSVATDLQQALDGLRPGEVDLVLLDLGLADSAGLDTVFRVTEAAPAVPVVVTTGRDDDDLGEQALLAGAQDFLVKGRDDGAGLLRRLRFTLARHRHALDLLTSVAQAPAEDLERLESLGGAGTGVASRSLGRVSLAETYPEAFAQAVTTYGELVARRIEERGLHVDYQVSSRTRAAAWDLGHLRATPRDVVDLHLAALRPLAEGRTAARAHAMYRSGESQLTETLGHLASFYRSQLLGATASARRRGPTDAAAGEDQA